MFDKKSDNERPTSPHLSIYRPQISSVMSIGHRISGVGIFFVLSLFCWWFTVWVFSRFNPCYLEYFDYLITKVVLVMTSYTFFYHVSTGIRHLIWDTGKCFSILAVKVTGWGALALSVALTVIFWLCI